MWRALTRVLALLLAVAVLAAPVAGATDVRSASSASAAPQVAAAVKLVGVALPAAGALAPPADAHLFASATSRHVVLGFIGADGFGGVTRAEFAAVSQLVTNAVPLSASGALSTRTPGWTDLSDVAFPAFVQAAHASEDRVLLGISSSSPASMAHLLRGPSRGATTLARAVTPILLADHLDGVDLDIEAGNASQSAAFTTFVSVLQRLIERADARAELVVNVSPGAAATAGFFNVRALASIATYLFVMDYDMVPGGFAGANAPLTAAPPQASDLSSLAAYLRVAAPSKVILGVPFYGYDFPTATRVPGAVTTGDAESVTYDDIVTVGRVGHWDATTLTPYYVFKRGKQWHETYYDDPVSIALKVALAYEFRLAGVGVWSLGQEGGSSAMLSALDGGAAPLHLPVSPS